ncbi:hypothetical protein M407DRAFT_76026 [Tulasnella calospora MUT 4182]|uniref:AB hydrolase-1 domain-containing protein n=1 Tax=Tulasnella calospora MUT 4182 TaxID=1051891 RepID=A0A0C3QG16_9AGAM|nr:hypothetical protein M407DRAFT_76026 [Tulasnella calospora MUT 4182]
MDPFDFFSFNHQYANLGSESDPKRYHYVDQKPEGFDEQTAKNFPTLLLIHGFPDLWYGWRYQIGPWVRAGYRVIAPDCAGYGQTAKPTSIAAYTPKSITSDLVALLDHLGISKVVVIGHDWGAAIAWRFCAFAPDRVKALIVASVPFNPPAKEYLSPSEVSTRAPLLGYMEYFASEESTKEIESRLFKFVNLVFRRPPATEATSSAPTGSLAAAPTSDGEDTWPLPGRLRSGMQGPLSYYRTGQLRVAEEKDLPPTLPGSLPILFLHPQRDPTCLPSQVDRMKKKFIPQVSVKTLDCGHWVMLEEPEAVARGVLDWLVDIRMAPPELDRHASKL